MESARPESRLLSSWPLHAMLHHSSVSGIKMWTYDVQTNLLKGASSSCVDEMKSNALRFTHYRALNEDGVRRSGVCPTDLANTPCRRLKCTDSSIQGHSNELNETQEERVSAN